jgi:hypothetical protein
MNLDTIYHTVQSSPHGGSGRGTSYWRSANECGRLVQLTAKYPPPAAEGTTNDDDDLNPLLVGTYYHALHEGGLAGLRDGLIWDMTDTAVQEREWLEALRLYRAYIRDWGNPLAKWNAKLVSVEEKLPKTDAGKALVRELFGEDVTFRADWVGEIQGPNSADVILENGDVVIFDHKTTKSRKAIHEWEFMFGNQSAFYLYLYNLENPERPAKAQVYDQILRHVDISKGPLLNKSGGVKRESSYQHFVARPNENAEAIIRNMVATGKLNLEYDNGRGRANAAHCFSGYKPCWFFQNGLCERY